MAATMVRASANERLFLLRSPARKRLSIDVAAMKPMTKATIAVINSFIAFLHAESAARQRRSFAPSNGLRFSRAVPHADCSALAQQQIAARSRLQA
ncbi:MAG TPA: hypothetical protein VHX14_08505 [Thermoanaerobaculia bacterium]|jgi:hypothetical protein|nr:hypothetical protein [Thermoanaerobaculia bacterium]